MRMNSNLFREHKQERVRQYYVLALQFALILVGPSKNPTALTGDVVNESEAREYAEKVGGTLHLYIDNYCLQLAYYFHDYERADRFSHTTQGFGKQVRGHHWVTRNMFFRGLTASALAAKGRNRRKNMKIARKALSQLKKWANAGNVNCIHTVQLLEAEAAALRHDVEGAKRLFEASIHTASRNGYLNDKALAHERAFLFHLKHDEGDQFWTTNHYNDAVQAYCDWNAYEKARHLVRQYGELIKLNSNSSRALSKVDGDRELNVSSQSSDQYDSFHL
jgi:histidine kinase